MGENTIDVLMGFDDDGIEVQTGTKQAEVIFQRDGLAVTVGIADCYGRFVITHIHSGRKLPNLSFACAESAQAALLRILQAGSWDRAPSAVRADPAWPAMKAAALAECGEKEVR